jgi:hypothetical protein
MQWSFLTEDNQIIRQRAQMEFPFNPIIQKKKCGREQLLRFFKQTAYSMVPIGSRQSQWSVLTKENRKRMTIRKKRFGS